MYIPPNGWFHLFFHSNLTQTDSAVIADIVVGWILTTTTAGTGIIIHHLTYVEVTYNNLLRNFRQASNPSGFPFL